MFTRGYTVVRCLQRVSKSNMTDEDYRHFVCIAAGENPDDLMSIYDKNKEVEPYVVYRFKDVKKIKDSFIAVYENALKETDIPSYAEYIRMTIQDLAEMDDSEFYEDLVDKYGLSMDEETGDAYSDKNKNGKWSSYSLGKIFSIPFLTKDGREVFQAKKRDIDWEKIHLNNQRIYERAWEMVMDASNPETDYEGVIYENMKDKRAYFEKFGTKENYVISNTAFWGYAFVSEKTGWVDADDAEDQFVWMSTFYDLFIKNLDDDTLLTIFECTK